MNDQYSELTFDSLCDEFERPEKTIILFHARPDADAIGSSFALKLLLEDMGSEAYCLCENEIPERLRFLTENIQESVLLSSLSKDFNSCRCISVDTASPSQLGTLFDVFNGRIDLMIDHHAAGTPYADNYIKADSAASGEIIFEIAKKLVKRGKLKKIPKRACELLYAAISSDTGCFRYSNTTPNTHLCAAELLRSGIDTARINHYLFDSKSVKVLSAESEGFKTIRFFGGGKIAIAVFPYELKVKLGLMDEHLETLVDIARSVEGVEVAAAVRQSTEKNIFRASLRSSSDVDVSLVCRHFGGGGHIKAAGCTVEAENALAAAELIAAETEKQIKK